MAPNRDAHDRLFGMNGKSGAMQSASERRPACRAVHERIWSAAVIVGLGFSVAPLVALASACTNTDPIPFPQVDAAAPDATFEADGGR